jgi:hypothetical protein
MTDPERSQSFLSRWSRRKLAAARAGASRDHPAPDPKVDAASPGARPDAADAPRSASPAAARAAPGVAATVAPVAKDRAVPGAIAGADAPPHASAAAPPAGDGAPQALPPVDSLTFDSDFTRFMAADVDPAVRRAALRKLLHDPRFNVMDGLDVYIDDYTKPSPIAPQVARNLAHARYLFAPPRTRVNAAGHVEDVPDAAQPGVDDAQVAAGHAPTGADAAQTGADHAPTRADAAQTAADAAQTAADAARTRADDGQTGAADAHATHAEGHAPGMPMPRREPVPAPRPVDATTAPQPSSSEPT